jgi:hypothetical protein
MEEKGAPAPAGPAAGDDDDADSDDNNEEKGISMDFTPRNDTIIPTYEGFKFNVHEVNPRLPKFLVDRLGQEQLRRYKKLVGFKVGHAQAKERGACDSGIHCVDQGGVPEYLPSKASQKEPTLSHTGFSAAGLGELDEDAEAVADGIVTAAQFPAGVPMPPVKRLPAKFECPLCFAVKRFQKPSDWSKHVHEDLQPFTCTFQACPDPKSFKRKADWVRHENERHRQLEWWLCSEEGCVHKCFRRDNFVQHLVREHKMPEPKAKTTKPNRPAVRGPAKSKGRGNKDADSFAASEDQVLAMVESCRNETSKQPADEPCRFCGNICNSWKKLTVHLARHMEQISMPVLKLVDQKDVTPDTIISPIEAKPAHQPSVSPSEQTQSGQVGVLGAPFDIHMGIGSIKQELPGSFTPIAAGPAFRPPAYEPNGTPLYGWGATSAQTPSIPTHAPTGGYGGAMEHPYLSGHGSFQGGGSQQFASVGPSGQYLHATAATGGDMVYNTSLNGHVPRLTQTSYAGDQPFQVPLEGPHFSTPQYTSAGGMSTPLQAPVPAARAMPMQYDVSGELSYPPMGDGMVDYQPQPQQQQQQQQQRQQQPYYHYQMR